MKYPTKVEKKYQKYLHNISRNLRKTTTNYIAQMTALLRNDSTERQDLIEQIKDVYYESRSKDEAIDYINEICSEVDEQTRESLAEEFYEQTGNELYLNRSGEVFDIEWSAIQNEHINEIEDSFFKKVALLLGIALLAGKSFNAIQEDINKVYKQTDQHAERIAINEISNLSSAKNRNYQQELGVEIFMWQTEEDERVRKTHKARNKKYYYWNKKTNGIYKGVKVYATPPTLPSEEIMCRCVAKPIFNNENRV